MIEAQTLQHVVFAGIGALLLSLMLTPLIRRFALATNCVSRPVHDRWGHRLVARLGGIPIALCFLAAASWATWHDHRMAGLLAAGLLMTATGLLDDFKRLNPYTKLIAQIIAGCLVVLSGIQVDITIMWLAIPLTIGWLVLVMNAFNLMDNMDGLSAGVGVIAAGFCIWHAVNAQQWLIAVLLASLAGSTLGFLRYNLAPAKIFMGDTGSQLLGLGVGALALMGSWGKSTHLLGILAFPTLLLAVPIFDTCFVAIQRFAHGRHPFEGGTDHSSHRLGILGLTTRQVVFTLYALSAAFGAISILMASQGNLMVIGIWLVAVGLFLLAGAYLARVTVYAGAQPIPEGPRVTLIETMLMHKRRLLEVAVDFVLICAAFVFAHLLRFEATLTPNLEQLIFKALPWIIVIKMACFVSCGLYRGLWRYISIPDMVNVIKAVGLGSILSALLVLFLWRFEGYSRAVFIIDGLLLFLFIGGARMTEPVLNEWITASLEGFKPVLIVGAGDTGELILQQVKIDRIGSRRAVGFLDDNAAKQGTRIHGIPVLGTRHELNRILQEHRIREVLIAIRRPPAELVAHIQSTCEAQQIAWSVAGITASGEPAAVTSST